MHPQTSKTVLVVDDQVENIEILSNLLGSTYKVKAARSGQQALHIIQTTTPPDIVLLDIKMPEMDGYEVITRLKETPDTDHIPVIFVTAKGETFDQTKAFALGAADYIIKPISPEIVLARVATHIALHDIQQSLQAKVDEEVSKRIKQEQLLLKQSRLAAMGEMMSAITHQWKQPLSVIGAVSASLHFAAQFDTLEKDEVLSGLQIIDDNLAFTSQTMSDFKNYFKPGKHKKIFSIHDEVTSIVSMLKPIMYSHSINVTIDIPVEVTGFGMASEFKQVVLNLLSNAKDAINARRNSDDDFKPTITITATRQGDTSILNVADNGGGIPEAILGKIFDDYYTTKEQHGTGIGLTMSKMILEEQMHGSIHVQNHDDGARFTLEFPATGAADDDRP